MALRQDFGGQQVGGAHHQSRHGKYAGLAALSRLGDSEEVVESGGLLGGLTAWHFRLLTENPWNGGGGYDVRDVANWTLDQIWFRLCDMNVLKGGRGGRSATMDPSVVKVREDGVVYARAEDGTVIRGRIAGKSLARQLMEQEAEKRKGEELWKAKKERRRRKKGG